MSNAKKSHPAAPAPSSDSNAAQEQDLMQHTESVAQKAQQASHLETHIQIALGGTSPAKIQALKQATQAAFNESMAWHETEERLLTCISKSRAAELEQEIERLRVLRRTAIGAGQTSGKDYKQLSQLIATAQSERDDLDIVAQELEQGALDRAVVGQKLWRAHLGQRRELASNYLQWEINASRMEVRAALAPVLPLLTKLAAKIEQRRTILSAQVDYSEGRQPDFSPVAPVSATSIGEVVAFLTALLPSNVSTVDAGFDQEIMTEIKQCPPGNLIRGDLVGSRAKKIQNLKLQKMQREPKAKPTSAKQRAEDNWSFESMQIRNQNVR